MISSNPAEKGHCNHLLLIIKQKEEETNTVKIQHKIQNLIEFYPIIAEKAHDPLKVLKVEFKKMIEIKS